MIVNKNVNTFMAKKSFIMNYSIFFIDPNFGVILITLSPNHLDK